MQEEIDQKAIALVINAGKMTGRTLLKAVSALGRQISKNRTKRQEEATGKVSMKNLRRSRGDLATIDLQDDLGRKFDKIARKYQVKYAIYRTEPGKYIVFFKSPETEGIKRALAEYRREGSKDLKKSLRKVLAEKSREQRRTHREKTREHRRQQER